MARRSFLFGETQKDGFALRGLCRVKGNFYVHLVKALQGDRVLIGNDHGHINGWTTLTKVYRIVV